LKAAISTLIYRKLKQLRGELHGQTWVACSSSDQAPQPIENMASSSRFCLISVSNGDQFVEEVEWGSFVAKSGMKSRGLGAWWRTHGGEEEEVDEAERDSVVKWGGAHGQVTKKRGTRANYQFAPPNFLSFIFGLN